MQLLADKEAIKSLTEQKDWLGKVNVNLATEAIGLRDEKSGLSNQLDKAQ